MLVHDIIIPKNGKCHFIVEGGSGGGIGGG
jgi:hypothetical protein